MSPRTHSCIYIESVNWVVIAIVCLIGGHTRPPSTLPMSMWECTCELTDTSFPSHLIITVIQTQLKVSSSKRKEMSLIKIWIKIQIWEYIFLQICLQDWVRFAQMYSSTYLPFLSFLSVKTAKKVKDNATCSIKPGSFSLEGCFHLRTSDCFSSLAKLAS